MKIKLDVPEAGDVDLIVAGVGLVHNGGTFEVAEDVGNKLLNDPKFTLAETKKGSEK